ncbi:MAG: YkgJ family cysteine cluster protein [Methanosarcinales archaeon]|nr:YkgJ family cysteine cluster protein [Methanosarcinales archaeon]
MNVNDISHSIRDVGFKCMKCGWCCCPDPEFEIEILDIHRPSNAISVLPRDIRAIQDATGCNLLDVVEPDVYSCIRGEKMLSTGWILKRKHDGTCMFFDDNRNLCTIYEYRPLICMVFPFFLDSSGMLVVRHCYGTHQQMEGVDAFESGQRLVRYLTSTIEHYIAICEGLGAELDVDKLSQVRLEHGLVLQVFDGENISTVKYSDGAGFHLVQDH